MLGMGGSGIAGDVLVATAAPFMPVPVTVQKSYELPAFVGEGSLVFAISFSGNTEETVEAATDAAVQGAKVVVVSSGGQLVELAGSWGAPVVRVPKNIPQPRAAIGALAIPPIAILEEMGLFPGAGQWITYAIDQLKRRRDELQTPGNAAEKLAENSVGSSRLFTAVAHLVQRPHKGGRRRSTRTRRAQHIGLLSPSFVTTKLWAGTH